MKTTGLPDKPASSKNDSSKLASNKNNNNRLTSRKNDSNNNVNKFGVSRNGIEHTKKSEKLSKSGKSKSKKISKFRNLAKSEKKLLKSGNLTNFDAMGAGPKFLTPDARTAFNCLWLAFTETSIL